MDCLHAAELLMSERDGEHVDAADLAHAHEHCASCPACMALSELLDRMSALPPLRAPEDLVERLVTMSAEAAADVREARAAEQALLATGATVVTGESRAEVVRTRPRITIVPGWWGPRYTAMAAAAAVLLLAVGVGTVGMIGMLGSQSADETALVESAPTSDSGDAAAESGALAAPPADGEYRADAAVAAPSYIAYDGFVWVLEEQPADQPSQPTTGGVVTSSLSASGEAETHDVYLSADGRTLWIGAPDGTFYRFALVVRTYGRAPYALTSEGDITRFGVWPGLPSHFAQPTGPDGSPTFTLFGFDDRNVNVFVPLGGIAQDGFAIAPGGPSDDPAAGNPNWTWWEPLP